jgi:hypothetical protein
MRRALITTLVPKPMEPTSPADDSAPEISTEPPADTPLAEAAADVQPDADAGPEPEQVSPAELLNELAARAEKGRLTAAEEAQAALAIKGSLLDGRAGVALVVELLPKFAWMVAVNGVTAAWPELTSGFRTQLFSGLSKDESDSARRLRLSLARGIFKQDVPSALKIAGTVAKELREKEAGVLSAKDAQIFAAVFIGRAKPWLAALPLAEMKPAEAEALAHCALMSVFVVPHPPLTQLGVIKWAAAAGRLENLDEAALSVVKPGVARWSGKWQGALRREVAALPEEIASVLKEPAPAAEAVAKAPREDDEATAEEPAAERADDELDADADEESAGEPREPAPTAPRQYPVYVSKTIPPREPAAAREEAAAPAPAPAPQRTGRGSHSPANLNVNEALKQIEAHVAWLRGELKAAQIKLKDREPDRRRRTERASAPIVTGEPTIEELARLNLQLEARITELQQRIDDLTADAEDRAASVGAASGEGQDDPAAALRALLALKLQEDYEDFVALEHEGNDVVVQAHYQTLLRHVFEVLVNEHVEFKNPE